MTHISAMTQRMVPAIATRGRLIAMTLMAIFGIAIAILLRQADATTDDLTVFVAVFGFTIFVPLVALVISTATLGNLVEEQTLVYFWLRPFGRWKIATAAIVAGVLVLVPLILVPMGVLGAIAGGDAVLGALVGSAVGLVAYLFVFTMLGLFTQRALAWGLLYVLVWEGLIAGFSTGAGRLAIRSYANAAMTHISGVEVASNPPTSLTIGIVTASVAAVCFAITTWRLNTMTVD